MLTVRKGVAWHVASCCYRGLTPVCCSFSILLKAANDLAWNPIKKLSRESVSHHLTPESTIGRVQCFSSPTRTLSAPTKRSVPKWEQI